MGDAEKEGLGGEGHPATPRGGAQVGGSGGEAPLHNKTIF